MEEPPVREEEEEEGDEDEERDEAGPEGALGKSPFQLTAEDVYDISYLLGRELMALGSDPRVTQLQFKVVRVLEMLEALVNEGSLAVEELKMERDSLRKEVEGLRSQGPPASEEVEGAVSQEHDIVLQPVTEEDSISKNNNEVNGAAMNMGMQISLHVLPPVLQIHTQNRNCWIKW
ncbi:RILP-like protein 2 isoform X2 [Callithrix jacchus]